MPVSTKRAERKQKNQHFLAVFRQLGEAEFQVFDVLEGLKDPPVHFLVPGSSACPLFTVQTRGWTRALNSLLEAPACLY